MSADGNLLTPEANIAENGSISDYYRSDAEENADSTLERKFANIGKTDSLKSTRSLSVFRDQSATKAMARSEEMTYNIYQDIDIRDDVTDRREDGGSGEGGGGEGEDGRGRGDGGGEKSSESRHYIKSASRQRGTFQLKTSGSSSSIPSIVSSSLHDEQFKTNLSNSLTRRMSSGEGSEGGSLGRSSSQQNGFSSHISMDPGGSVSASSTLESKIGSKRGQWNNNLSSASSTSTLTSVDGAGATAGAIRKKMLAERALSEPETGGLRTGTRKSGYSSDIGGGSPSTTREVVSYSVSRYSPAEIDTSNSLVRDKNFRANLAALFGGRGGPVSSSAPASLTRSRKVYATSDDGTESRDSTLSRDIRDVESSVDSRNSTLEGRVSTGTRSPRSNAPLDLKEVITAGKVNKVANELLIRGVPLTGRSMTAASSVSSLDRSTLRSEDGGSLERKKFKYERTDSPEVAVSDATLTAESEDDVGTGRQKKNNIMSVNLLRDIRNKGKIETKKNSDQELSENGIEANCSQGEITIGNRNSQIIEGPRSLAVFNVNIKDKKTEAEKHDSAANDLNETDQNDLSKSTGSVLEDVNSGNDVTFDKKSDFNSIRSETYENAEGFEEISSASTSFGRGVGGLQGSGNDVTGAASVSVEITDGSETGQSYNQEDTLRTNDVTQFGTNFVLDDSEEPGRHVLKLPVTSEDDYDVINKIWIDPMTQQEKSEISDRTALGLSGPTIKDVEQSEISTSTSTLEADSQPVPKISRKSNLEKVSRSKEKFSDGEAFGGKDGNDVTLKIEKTEGLRRINSKDSNNSQPREDGRRSREMITGRQKINHVSSTDSTNTTTERFLSPNIIENNRGTGGAKGEFAQRNITPAEPSRRNVIITGRDNIKRIAPMNSNVTDDGEVERGARNNLGSINPSGSTYETVGGGLSRSSSVSYDPQVTSENAAQISFSSDESPRLKTPTPVWVHPQNSAGKNTSGKGGLVIKISPDGEDEITQNSRRLSSESGTERGAERFGMYEPNRRRSRQRKVSRQITDSSLTDQEAYENAGHRSSVMRRRMKRHISRQSIESEPDDQDAYSEPEYDGSTHHETYLTRTSTAPVTGLVSNARAHCASPLSPELTRPQSVPLQGRVSNVSARPASVIRRSVTPVTGRISVPLSFPNHTEFTSKTMAPMTGLISVPNPPRPSSSASGTITNIIHDPFIQVEQDLPYSPTSPNGSSYLRTLNVRSPDNPELIAIDPELRDAQKTGNIYHITMCIRPIVSMSRPGSVVQSFELVDTAVRTVSRRSHNGPGKSWLLTEEDIGLPSTRPSTSMSQHPPSSGRISQNQVGFHLELQGGQQVKTTSYETIKDSEVSSRLQNGAKPDLEVELGMRASVDILDEEEGTVKSPKQRTPEKLPQIERGSILIKNRIDTSRPQIIDLITTDDDAEAEEEPNDNSNMFHERYLLRKENPLYTSNPDLNKWEAEEEDSEQAFDAIDFREHPSAINGPKSLREEVGGGLRHGRPTTSDSKETARIGHKSKSNEHDENDEIEYDENFDIDVPVNQRRSRENQSEPRKSNGFGIGNHDDWSESSSFFGGKMNGYSGSTVTRMMTQNDVIVNGSKDDYENFEEPYKNDVFDLDVKVNRDYRLDLKQRNSGGGFNSSVSRQQQRNGQSESSSLFAAGSNVHQLNEQTIQTLNIRSLMVGSSSSVKQTIKVDRVEDEILSGIPADEMRQRQAVGASDLASALGFDKVSEQVDMDVTDGKVILTSRARSERTVPIMGSEDLYKKSAVIVTKRIEIDMTLTPQRSQLYDMIRKRQDEEGRNGTLDKRETFELYKKFVALADLDMAMAT